MQTSHSVVVLKGVDAMQREDDIFVTLFLQGRSSHSLVACFSWNKDNLPLFSK